MSVIDKLRINNTTYDVQDSKSLHYTEAQTLTDAQKTQVRSNAGAASAADVTSMGTRVTVLETSSSVLASKVVRHDAQTLTDTQKEQARTNIGAADSVTATESHGTLFPDTFWQKLNLINADCNQNSEANNPINYSRLYHITTEKILHFDHALTVSTTDATLQVADRIYTSDGTFVSTVGWKRTLTIPANAYFRLVFRAQPDDTSVTLDITTSMAKVTFAMASALDDYSTTQATTAAIAASAATKVNVAQGAANAGKALIVGNDGNVTPGEAGVPEAVKTALLNIFQHVAYTDDQGQSYYDALYAALYPSAYPRIVATYNPGSNTVYTDDALDTLKQYMTVTYYETAQSAGTTVASNDYTLSGTLVEGGNTVVVGYDGMVTTVSVTAVDYYNQWQWSLTDGLLDVKPGASGSGTVPCNIYISTGWNNLNNRRVICAKRGRVAYQDYNTSEPVANAYPIPVPATANRVTLAITPSTQQFGASVFKLNNGVYTNVASSGTWENSKVINFTASDNLFLMTNCRHDTNNGNYGTDEPTEFTVTFETAEG